MASPAPSSFAALAAAATGSTPSSPASAPTPPPTSAAAATQQQQQQLQQQQQQQQQQPGPAPRRRFADILQDVDQDDLKHFVIQVCRHPGVIFWSFYSFSFFLFFFFFPFYADLRHHNPRIDVHFPNNLVGSSPPDLSPAWHVRSPIFFSFSPLVGN